MNIIIFKDFIQRVIFAQGVYTLCHSTGTGTTMFWPYSIIPAVKIIRVPQNTYTVHGEHCQWTAVLQRFHAVLQFQCMGWLFLHY